MKKPSRWTSTRSEISFFAFTLMLAFGAGILFYKLSRWNFTEFAEVSRSENLDAISILFLFSIAAVSLFSYLTVQRLKKKVLTNYRSHQTSTETDKLVTEARVRTRMEAELQMARTVQTTFFPKPHASMGPVEISGHFELASECGGDWWYYRDHGDKVSLFIGDITGHGVSAALMTSAVYATCFCADRSGQGEFTPKDYLTLISDTLYSTTRGKFMMTFFMAQIQKSTGVMTYSMAGHEPPMLLRGSEDNISMRCYHYLNEVNGPRLGESHGEQYSNVEVKLEPGDRIFLFTDGLYAAESLAGQELGLRRMHKIIAKSLSEHNDTQSTLESVVNEVSRWRSGAPLVDDLTALVVKFSR